MTASGWTSTAIVVMGGALLCGCAAPPAPGATNRPAAGKQEQASILVASTPVAGSTVAGPVDELKLRFNRPVRLHDVTVTGPSGMMPMMITAVGETSDYSLPLNGLEPGTYTVAWKAFSGTTEHRGSFTFAVK